MIVPAAGVVRSWWVLWTGSSFSLGVGNLPSSLHTHTHTHTHSISSNPSFNNVVCLNSETLNRNTHSSGFSSSSSPVQALLLSAGGPAAVCALICMFLFVSADPRTDDFLLDWLERLTATDTVRLLDISSERFTVAARSARSVSHLARSSASTREEVLLLWRLSGSWWRSKVRRGVGGSVAESVVSVGSHRALCSDCSWLRWSLEKLAPQARWRYNNACCLNSFTWTGHRASLTQFYSLRTKNGARDGHPHINRKKVILLWHQLKAEMTMASEKVQKKQKHLKKILSGMCEPTNQSGLVVQEGEGP